MQNLAMVYQVNLIQFSHGYGKQDGMCSKFRGFTYFNSEFICKTSDHVDNCASSFSCFFFFQFQIYSNLSLSTTKWVQHGSTGQPLPTTAGSTFYADTLMLGFCFFFGVGGESGPPSVYNCL